jgi:hypothetical protein
VPFVHWVSVRTEREVNFEPEPGVSSEVIASLRNYLFTSCYSVAAYSRFPMRASSLLGTTA